MPHEKLKVYELGLQLQQAVDQLVPGLRSRPELAEQLRKASLSVVLNIAEGAGEFRAAEKARFYRMAKRSSTEVAAALDVAVRTRLVRREAAEEARDLCRSVGFLLTRLIQSCLSRKNE